MSLNTDLNGACGEKIPRAQPGGQDTNPVPSGQQGQPVASLNHTDAPGYVFFVSTTACALGFFLTAMGPVKVMMARDLGVAQTELLFLGSVYGFAMLVAALLANWLLRSGIIWALRFAPLLVGLGSVVLVFAPNVPTVLFGALIAALGCAITATSMSVAFSGARATRNMTLVNGVGSAASVFSTLLFSAADTWGAFSGHWALLAIVPINLLGLVLAWRTPVHFHEGSGANHLPPSPVSSSVSGQDGESVGKDISTASRSKAGSVHKPAVLFQSLRVVLAICGEFVIYGYGVNLLMHAGAGAGEAAFYVTGFALGMALGRIGLANLTMRPKALRAFASLAAAGFLALAVLENFWALALALVVLGVGVSGCFPITIMGLNRTKNLQAHHSSMIFGIISGVGALGAPLLFGLLSEAFDLRLLIGLLSLTYLLLAFLPPQAFVGKTGPQSIKKS